MGNQRSENTENDAVPRLDGHFRNQACCVKQEFIMDRHGQCNDEGIDQYQQ
jgi:hypothetical protein